MTVENEARPPQTNRVALISLGLAILTFIFFCAGVFPIPFTGYVCFPASALTGILAFITGAVSLVRARMLGGSGRIQGWIGAITGGLTIILLACLAIAVVSMMPEIANLLRQYSK